jgi:predicted dehydrogenase
MIRVGLIGLGLIGRERLRAIRRLGDMGCPIALAGIHDADDGLLQRTADEFGALAFRSGAELIAQRPDWTVVALPHDVAVPVALDALAAGGRVLIEKPMGRDFGEACRLAKAGGERLWVGFNYRFFPGVRRILQDAKGGVFGRLIGAEFVVGHGCAPGQEKTWKLDLERAGGGCLIDPGVHLLDLCQLLAPEKLTLAGGLVWDGFWKTGIEEDVQVLLSAGDLGILMQTSIVRWRSTFRVEIRGTEGYGIVQGRGRSYGPQTYLTGPRWGWLSGSTQKDSETLVLEDGASNSFSDELEALFWPGAQHGREWPHPCTANEALERMALLDHVRSRLGLLPAGA